MRRKPQICTHGDNEQDEVTLFSFLKSPLPSLASPKLPERIGRYLFSLGRKKSRSLPLILISAKKNPINSLNCQLTLSLTSPQRPTVVRFVPRHRHPYLARGVYDTFCDVRGAEKAALKLEANRIFLVGQLVQLSEEEAGAFQFMDQDTLRIMKDELAALGLGFGTRVPSWNAEFKSLLSMMP